MYTSNPLKLFVEDLAVESFVLSTDTSLVDEDSSKPDTKAATCPQTCQVGTGREVCAGCW
jgi:hypothetical protein